MERITILLILNSLFQPTLSLPMTILGWKTNIPQMLTSTLTRHGYMLGLKLNSPVSTASAVIASDQSSQTGNGYMLGLKQNSPVSPASTISSDERSPRDSQSHSPLPFGIGHVVMHDKLTIHSNGRVWRIGNRLGNGEYGQVHEATLVKDHPNAPLSPRTRRNQVVKITDNTYNDPKHEARVLSSLNRLTGYAEQEVPREPRTLSYLIMNKESGKTMEQHLQNVKSPNILAIQKAGLTAIKSFHDKGYVHGDTRLANFMVDELGKQATIIDMGHARQNQSPSQRLNDIIHFLEDLYMHSSEIGASHAKRTALKQDLLKLIKQN